MDFTVRLGDLLTMAGLFGGGVVVVVSLRAAIHALGHRMDAQDIKIGAIGAKMDRITDIIAEQARHDERLRFVETQVRELKLEE